MHLPTRVSTISKCNMQVTISFFTNRITKELQWEDLMGPEKYIALGKINLPETLPNLPNVQDLWKDFKQLYGVLQQQSITFADANKFKSEVKNWVRKFTSIYVLDKGCNTICD